MKYKKLLLLTLISVFVFTGSSFAAGTSTEENVSKYENPEWWSNGFVN